MAVLRPLNMIIGRFVSILRFIILKKLLKSREKMIASPNWQKQNKSIISF